jgi:hypothetical protein
LPVIFLILVLINFSLGLILVSSPKKLAFRFF